MWSQQESAHLESGTGVAQWPVYRPKSTREEPVCSPCGKGAAWKWPGFFTGQNATHCLTWQSTHLPLAGQQRVHTPLHHHNWTLEGFNIFPSQQLWGVSTVPYAVLQADDSKGISAVIQRRNHALLEKFQRESNCSCSNCAGVSIIMLPKNGSQIASLMFAQETNCWREVWMQVSLASVYPRDVAWCDWEVAGGMRRELSWGMTNGAVSYAGIESLLRFICHVQLQCRGEDYTALITTTLVNSGKQERSGSSVNQNSWSWEN